MEKMYRELNDKQKALLTQSHLEYCTRKAIRVFWIIFGGIGGFVAFVVFSCMIFGAKSDIFGYVVAYWLVSLPICAILSYALVVIAILVDGIYEGIAWQIKWYRFTKRNIRES